MSLLCATICYSKEILKSLKLKRCSHCGVCDLAINMTEDYGLCKACEEDRKIHGKPCQLCGERLYKRDMIDGLCTQCLAEITRDCSVCGMPMNHPTKGGWGKDRKDNICARCKTSDDVCTCNSCKVPMYKEDMVFDDSSDSYMCKLCARTKPKTFICTICGSRMKEVPNSIDCDEPICIRCELNLLKKQIKSNQKKHIEVKCCEVCGKEIPNKNIDSGLCANCSKLIP